MQDLLFYIFSGAMLFFGILTIASRNPVNSAIFLILVFFFMAALYVLLHAFFLAAVQILVYAGAIMVLFLFVVMLLNIKEEQKRSMHWFGVLGVLVILPCLAFELFSFLRMSGPPPAELTTLGTTEGVGRLLFTSYIFPFEVTSLLLLVAMIGVIILSKKQNAS